ncbi:secreted protein [Cutibacterium acnes JCM 18909]|nr:secreted protein [Cutibacterium acnes JCM 18909]
MVQIDHVVALGNAWVTGAQQLPMDRRQALANDPLNLLAVEGQANQNKGAGDAATWLPPHKSYRCDYVSRQIAVKRKYHLWVTSAERNAMIRVLSTCPNHALPAR